MLAVVYLAKIEHLSLNNPVVRHPLVLNDAPVAMFFTVFKTVFSSKKHAPIFLEQNKKIKGVGRHYKRFWWPKNLLSIGYTPNIREIRPGGR